MDKKLIEYLNSYYPDSIGYAWVLVSRIEKDMGLSRDRIYDEVVLAQRKGFVQNLRTLEPGPRGLLSVMITKRGRAWLTGEDWTQQPMPHFNELVYGFDRK